MLGGNDVRDTAHARRRARLGWAVFLAVVLGLRAWGLGDEPPPSAEAAAESAAEVPDEDEVVATQALVWLVTGVDPLERADGATRCVRAGPACTPDDMLDADTTRARLESLAGELAAALDPNHAGHLGSARADVAARAERTQDAATVAAGRLGEWLAAGCGSTIDGMAVTDRPATCADLGRSTLAALDDAGAAHRSWFR